MNDPGKQDRYTIVIGCYAEHLAMNVNRLIKEGWKPIGGVCVSTAPREFFQAMVRE